jgi:hypothetical protein
MGFNPKNFKLVTKKDIDSMNLEVLDDFHNKFKKNSHMVNKKTTINAKKNNKKTWHSTKRQKPSCGNLAYENRNQTIAKVQGQMKRARSRRFPLQRSS